MKHIPLDELRPGQWGKIEKINSHGAMHRRMLDIGLTEGTAIKCIQTGPGGGISAYFVRGTVVAFRAADAHEILLSVNGG